MVSQIIFINHIISILYRPNAPQQRAHANTHPNCSRPTSSFLLTPPSMMIYPLLLLPLDKFPLFPLPSLQTLHDLPKLAVPRFPEHGEKIRYETAVISSTTSKVKSKVTRLTAMEAGIMPRTSGSRTHWGTTSGTPSPSLCWCRRIGILFERDPDMMETLWCGSAMMPVCAEDRVADDVMRVMRRCKLSASIFAE